MRILLVDDDSMSRELLASYLANDMGHLVTQCSDGDEAYEVFKLKPFPMVLTDLRMPKLNGLKLLSRLKRLPAGKTSDIVLVTGYGDMHSAIAALKAGAYDYLLKPVKIQEFKALVNRVAEHQFLIKDNYELTNRFEEKVASATQETESKLQNIRKAFSRVVGIERVGIFSDKMREAEAMAKRFHQDRTVPVLIEGETGTGKEIIARMIHYGEGEITNPFISINCPAISANLFESELFGYEAGAYTGAKKNGSMGKFELAQGGTLFLDEIGDMPLDLQAKLLRVVQEREIFRIGGLKKIMLDVRIIGATNRNLSQLVKEGKFRQDLFYRLNLGRILIPPLRMRSEEIIPLAEMFLAFYSEQKKRCFEFIGKEAAEILENHSWPGNVRELQNAIERIVLLYDDKEIKPKHLEFLTEGTQDSPFELTSQETTNTIVLDISRGGMDLRTMEKIIIRKILKKFHGNKSRTAAFLGISRNSINAKLTAT